MYRKLFVRRCRGVVAILSLVAMATTEAVMASGQRGDNETVVTVFDNVAIEYDPDQEGPVERGRYTVRQYGQIIERTVDLPELPDDQAEARRIVATITVQPQLKKLDGERYRPGDPWPRLGSISVVMRDSDDPSVAELTRFVTGFGGPGTFTQDLTALAPLLTGRTTMQVYISTFSSPGWTARVELRYSRSGVGPRRPVFALPVFFEEAVTAEESLLRRRITIPDGLDRPRLRIVSTGHATDGSGGDEFISRTHILRINGEEVIRFRPWLERGGILRDVNPMSGRETINGRELWSSDLDRSGWAPGHVVWPDTIPVPELTPGEHTVELEIQDIRPIDPADEDMHHGYWRVSVMVVADEPWPQLEGQ